MTRIEGGLLAAMGLFVVLAGVGWISGTESTARVARTATGRVIDWVIQSPESIDAAAHLVAISDPFRLDRHPTSVRYKPELDGVARPPKPPKPQLLLEGLVGNAALLDGVPGRGATTIVRAGDTLGGLRIRRIARDTVTVFGVDTTWHLTLRHPWQ